MSEKREPKFWSTSNDCEVLYFTDIKECLEAFVDNCEGAIPERVMLYGYAEVIPNKPFLAAAILETLLEDYLDDMYGGPDEYTNATDGMKEASKQYIEAVLKDYKVYQCEIVERKIVTIRDYITKEVHRHE